MASVGQGSLATATGGGRLGGAEEGRGGGNSTKRGNSNYLLNLIQTVKS